MELARLNSKTVYTEKTETEYKLFIYNKSILIQPGTSTADVIIFKETDFSRCHII